MTITHADTDSGPGADAIADALKKNIEAAAAVEDVADQLGVVHAVLRTKIAEASADADTEAAVDRTHELEQKLNETAEKMDEVNQAIEAQHASLAHLSKAN